MKARGIEPILFNNLDGTDILAELASQHDSKWTQWNRSKNNWITDFSYSRHSLCFRLPQALCASLDIAARDPNDVEYGYRRGSLTMWYTNISSEEIKAFRKVYKHRRSPVIVHE